MSKEKFKLGSEVKCVVTGYQGICVSRVEYINGCVQYCVKGKVGEDGKMPDGEYVDEQQLEFVNVGVDITATPTGGVMSDSPKSMGLSKK